MSRKVLLISKFSSSIKSLTPKIFTAIFIKKRKITKASIDELAKRYPQEVISDEDARNIVAGVCYYSISGTYLGQIGLSSEIRVFSDPSLYTATVNTGSLDEFNNPAYNGSTAFSNTYRSVKIGILSSEAAGYVPSGSTIYFQSNGTLGTTMEGTKSNNLIINIDSPFVSNLADLRSVLYHEQFHMNNGHNSITGSIESAEEQAYLAQMKHSSWSSVSDALKCKNRDILVSRFNYSLADANRLAGL